MPDAVAAAAVASWAALFGLVSFELFGQFENVITDRAAFFAHAVGILGRMVRPPRLSLASPPLSWPSRLAQPLSEPVSRPGCFPRIGPTRVAPVHVSNLYSIY